MWLGLRNDGWCKLWYPGLKLCVCPFTQPQPSFYLALFPFGGRVHLNSSETQLCIASTLNPLWFRWDLRDCDKTVLSDEPGMGAVWLEVVSDANSSHNFWECTTVCRDCVNANAAFGRWNSKHQHCHVLWLWRWDEKKCIMLKFLLAASKKHCYKILAWLTYF